MPTRWLKACRSYCAQALGGSPYADPATKKSAITNYRAMGATHIESLSAASPNPLTPKYSLGSASAYHPDGASFPGTGLNLTDIPDGLSHTIMATESEEQQFARWTVGADAAVVGLPRNVDFELSGGFVLSGRYLRSGGGLGGATVHRASEHAKDEWSNIAPVYWTHHTYLDWDYDKNPYDGGDGTIAGKYGASSQHPEVVNHLSCDGSVYSLSKDIDVSVYMHMITRHGDDPFYR